jgi:type I restriction enzyme M protein
MTPWTTKLWIFDLRTNMRFTLKTNSLRRSDLDDFVACYRPENRHAREEEEANPTGRWRAHDYA